MPRSPDFDPTREEFSKHEKRISERETKVGMLLKALGIKTEQPIPADLSTPEIAQGPAEESQAPAEKSTSTGNQNQSEEMSPALKSILAQLKSGDSGGAFKKFQALPKSELSQQPVFAATLAAAICVTQGDFPAGIKALEQVQQYSDDPRIEQIKQKLLDQAKKHKP